jgi:hypothetical protein
VRPSKSDKGEGTEVEEEKEGRDRGGEGGGAVGRGGGGAERWESEVLPDTEFAIIKQVLSIVEKSRGGVGE